MGTGPSPYGMVVALHQALGYTTLWELPVSGAHRNISQLLQETCEHIPYAHMVGVVTAGEVYGEGIRASGWSTGCSRRGYGPS